MGFLKSHIRRKGANRSLGFDTSTTKQHDESIGSTTDRLKSCLNDIEVWMSENKLKLNPDKTEFIVFGAKDRYKWLNDSFPVNIMGNCLSPTDVARNLGVV